MYSLSEISVPRFSLYRVSDELRESRTCPEVRVLLGGASNG